MSLLFVPSVLRGNGTGHLARCFAMAKSIQSAQKESACIFIRPAGADSDNYFTIGMVRLAYPQEAETLEIVDSLAPGRRFRLVVLDQRFSSMADLESWSAYGTVVAIDEGGPARSYVPYLIDLLPSVQVPYRKPEPRNANQSQPGLLPLPENRKAATGAQPALGSILISFGGEDKAGLAEKFLDYIYEHHLLRNARLTLVSGPLARLAGTDSSIKRWPGLIIVHGIQNMREHLFKYDLVVTHFGLTAYEAAWAGCAVLLFNPSRLHARLADLAGFPNLGWQSINQRRLAGLLANPARLKEQSRAALPAQKIDPAGFFAGILPLHPRTCPVCSCTAAPAVFRNERKTYFECPRCALVFMSYFKERNNPYTDTAYFFEQYKAQYGKTYLEDLPNLRAMARRRLVHIEAILGGAVDGAVVLDVGCAYGAFVLEAQSRGWSAFGSDVSSDAIEYVKKSCNVPAFVSDFAMPAADGLYPRQLDCLTMWYVIEHFEELARVLRRVHSLLKDGAVFAFSTPSGRGISWLARRQRFFELSPDDHFTIWSPANAGRILQYYGFKVKKIVVTGHHPERFPGVPNKASALRYRLMLFFSRLFGLGDTFECYAIKDDSMKAARSEGSYRV